MGRKKDAKGAALAYRTSRWLCRIGARPYLRLGNSILSDIDAGKKGDLIHVLNRTVEYFRQPTSYGVFLTALSPFMWIVLSRRRPTDLVESLNSATILPLDAFLAIIQALLTPPQLCE